MSRPRARALRALLALAAAMALAGCGAARTAAPPSGREAGGARPGQTVIPAGADPAAAARDVAARARGAAVVYLGELHDNPDHHAIQAHVLEALVAAGGRPAVAFEMVPEIDQALLEAAVRSDDGVEAVAERLGWRARGWPEFQWYWPLFALARAHGLPVVAADLDPAVTRRISRGGLGAAGEAPGRLRSALRDDPARDRAITKRIQAAHCDAVPETRAVRMVESWYARNVVIARRLVQALDRAPQVVVIIGRGHQSPGGVPEQVAALRPGTPQLVVAMLEAADEIARLGPDGAQADVLWITPGRERPDFCRGIRERLG